MDSNIDVLVQTLEELSPMPPDDSSQLTIERIRAYNEIIAQIGKVIRHHETQRDARLIKPLIQSFGYGNAYESYWPVIHILEEYSSDVLRPALYEAVQAGEPGARMWCTYMLGRYRRSEDVPILTAALKDPEPKVRCNALKALAMIGDLSAQLAMETLLDDPSMGVRRVAQECIETLVGSS